ncbi:hypothetical protein L2E82_13880 [Cichorium intybus]|uniref:Uncharacterized protein n=1 Tax=Cichorium intybus TaxID=13427 RepID=A0ACB9EYG2_CICIN|nr:hypothetical protein L2E82_13880 [Cichorium intybus]
MRMSVLVVMFVDESGRQRCSLASHLPGTNPFVRCVSLLNREEKIRAGRRFYLERFDSIFNVDTGKGGSKSQSSHGLKKFPI